PAPRKRAAEDDGAGPTTRSAKAPKTDKTDTSPKAARGGRGGKKGLKANLAASAFKARALPIHVNITHTPPVLADRDEGTVTLAATDPGFIGTAALVPSTFATGSYGWKGSKRFTVELENPDGGEEKEKVHVMLTINATVIGSKGAKEGEDGAEADEAAAEQKEAKETNGEAKDEVAKGDDMEEVKDGE
ncbi:hypothetical protein DICSQDRAFT_57734, partial [Dichomitus squalens LYAD-421 SS1]|uniref:uncharacterized protein n=1 Tax=Dichomitus squalens (strain LYAD-421) TaxID=732165 RepID=UPI0004410DF6